MSGVGPERHLLGLAAVDDAVGEDRDGMWVLERRDMDTWVVIGRYGSRAEAEAALDELAAVQERDLGDYRVRAEDAS